MFKVISFKPEHIDCAELTGFDVDIFLQKESKKVLQRDDHIAMTFLSHGRITAFSGMLINEHTGYVWLIPTIYLKQYKFETIKAIKQYIREFKQMFDLKCLITEGHEDETVKRWLQYMGFRPKKDDKHVLIKELC